MIDIQLDTREIEQKLSELQSLVGGRSLRPVMREIAHCVRLATEKNFDTEGARLGQRWKPSKRALKQGGKKRSGKTLQDTGRLVKSITSKVGRDYAVVGTNVEYGPIHQFGGTIRQDAQSRLQPFRVNMKTGRSRFSSRKKANFEQWTSRPSYEIDMPARPFLGLNDQDINDMGDIIRTAIQNAVKRKTPPKRGGRVWF